MPDTLVQIGPPRGFGETMRKDAWWVAPLVTFSVLTAFIVYTTWAAFQGEHYRRPLPVALLFARAVGIRAAARRRPSWWPGWLLLLARAAHPSLPRAASVSPATTTAAPTTSPTGPIRRAAPWASRARRYLGERSFPLILQNVHRCFLYAAIVFIFILGWDAMVAYRFADGFGIGVGTLVLTLNVVLLGGYTLRLPLAAAPGGRRASTSSSGGRCAPRSTTASAA